MDTCKIPGCGGTIVTETKIDGRVVRPTELYWLYDSDLTTREGNSSGHHIERVYHCDKCGVVYHHLPGENQNKESVESK